MRGYVDRSDDTGKMFPHWTQGVDNLCRVEYSLGGHYEGLVVTVTEDDKRMIEDKLAGTVGYKSGRIMLYRPVLVSVGQVGL